MKLTNEQKANMRFVGTSYGTTVVGHICNECMYNKGRFSVFGKQPYLCCFDQTASCSRKMPYYFFLCRSNKSIIVFSKGRIPFQLPKANAEAVKEFKDEIKTALELLQPFQGSFLYARYGTTNVDTHCFDIENILFYNIGTHIFNAVTKQYVAFASIPDTEIKKLQHQWNIPEAYSHYYEYTLLNQPALLPPENELLAEWDHIPFCKCTGLTPFASWNALRNAVDNIKIYNKINCDNGDKFALVLQVESPKQAKFNIATAMKPLLDGLICAFHDCDFEHSEVEYFSQKLSCDRSKFQNSRMNVLGNRKSKYLQIYRNNVKWNPADDACCHVAISVKEGTHWNLSGKIFKV